jgi:hypothetical protein
MIRFPLVVIVKKADKVGVHDRQSKVTKMRDALHGRHLIERWSSDGIKGEWHPPAAISQAVKIYFGSVIYNENRSLQGTVLIRD